MCGILLRWILAKIWLRHPGPSGEFKYALDSAGDSKTPKIPSACASALIMVKAFPRDSLYEAVEDDNR